MCVNVHVIAGYLVISTCNLHLSFPCSSSLPSFSLFLPIPLPSSHLYRYPNTDAYALDIRLIFNNCSYYNEDDSEVRGTHWYIFSFPFILPSATHMYSVHVALLHFSLCPTDWTGRSHDERVL